MAIPDVTVHRPFLNRTGVPRRRLAALAAAAMLAAAGACAARTHPLLDPRPADLAAPVPDSFRVRFETTRGSFDVVAHRQWAPLAVGRFHYLVRHRFYDDVRIFRVVPNFVAQFGLSGDSAVNVVWRERLLPDEATQRSNRRGTLAFARGGPNTRGTQVYVNLRDNPRLDTLNAIGFPVFAQVVEGMHVLDSLYTGYSQPGARAPSQDSVRLQGNAYLDREFPLLDAIRRARIVRSW